MMWKEEKRGLFPSSHLSPRAFYFLVIAIFLFEYPAGALRRREVLATESQYKQNAFLVEITFV